MGVNAALGKDVKEGVVDVDCRNTRESVCREVRRKPHSGKRGVLVGRYGRIHAVNAEATSPQQGRLDRPVVLNASVLRDSRSNETVTLVSIANDGRGGKHIVVTAVTSGYFLVGGDLMVELDIKLPAGVAANNHLAPVGVWEYRALYVGHWIEIQNRLSDRIDLVGWDYVARKFSVRARRPTLISRTWIIDASRIVRVRRV